MSYFYTEGNNFLVVVEKDRSLKIEKQAGYWSLNLRRAFTSLTTLM